jgi:hypothetical protein
VSDDEYAPSAPAKIWALTEIDGATKVSIMAIWSWSPHEDQRSTTGRTVYAKLREGMTPTESLVAKLSEQTGATARAIRDHISKIKSEGLASFHGLAVTLHWPALPESQRQQRRTVGKSARHHSGKTGEDVRHHNGEPDGKTATDDTMVATDDTGSSSHSIPPSSQIPNLSPSSPPAKADDTVRTSGEQSEFSLTSPGQEPSDPKAAVPAKRDRPAEVLAYLNTTKAALRERLQIRAEKPHEMLPYVRKWIVKRITDLGGGEQGVVACKRAIDVQASDAARDGTNTKAPGWVFLAPQMFSYADPFARKSERWSEDGNHRPHRVAQSQTRPAHDRGGMAPGRNADLVAASGEDDRLREERREANERWNREHASGYTHEQSDSEELTF